MTEQPPRKTPLGLVIGQVILESIIFHHRDDFLEVPADTKPELSALATNVQVGISDDGRRGFVRVMIVTPQDANDLYRIGLQMMATVLAHEDQPKLSVRDYVVNHGISLLYPFAREALASVTQKGRFGPVWLSPFDVQDVREQLRAVVATEPPGAPADSAEPPDQG